MSTTYEIIRALSPYRESAEQSVRSDPAMAEMVAAADSETGDRYLARNRLAIEIEMRMPSIGDSVEIVRRAKRKR